MIDGESDSTRGAWVAQLGPRLFPRFDEPNGTVQRMVGLIGGGGTILVGVVNTAIQASGRGVSFLGELLSVYTGLIFLMGLISIACGYWNSPVARWAQIGLFVFAGIFGALSANRGNITSAFFVVFAIVLLVEYRMNRRVAWVIGVAMLAGYVLALSVGYRDDVPRPVLSAFASLITILVFVGLFGGVTLRHRLLLRRNADNLESQVRQRTAALNDALSERTVMLQEIHHRVKNNMQTISTLLSMEMEHAVDPGLRAALTSSQHRIRAMAGVHDALYRSDRLDQVDLSVYIRDLVDTIVQASIMPVDLSLDTRYAGSADLSTAVSLGLVLNELVTNALKHAFNHRQGGKVHVTLQARETVLVLTVHDDGAGLPPGFDHTRDAGVGISVVTSIVTRCGGTISVTSEGGTQWRVEMPAASGTEDA